VERLVRPRDGIPGAMCGQQQVGHSAEALDQESEVAFRGLVDPVQVFNDDDERPALAPSGGQRPYRLEGLLALVLGIEMLERLVFEREAKDFSEERKDRHEGRIELEETLPELLADLERVVALLDLEVCP